MLLAQMQSMQAAAAALSQLAARSINRALHLFPGGFGRTALTRCTTTCSLLIYNRGQACLVLQAVPIRVPAASTLTFCCHCGKGPHSPGFPLTFLYGNNSGVSCGICCSSQDTQGSALPTGSAEVCTSHAFSRSAALRSPLPCCTQVEQATVLGLDIGL